MGECLKRDEQGRSKDLFTALAYQLATQAVLAGNAEGMVWVDALSNPTLALMKVGHRLYLAGDSRHARNGIDQLYESLFNQLLPEAKEHGSDGYLLYYSDSGWENVLQATIFAGRTVYPGRRNYYELSLPGSMWQPPYTPVLPHGLSLKVVDEGLMEETRLVHYDALVEEMQSERESVADFMSRSFGTVIVGESAILGWCLSEYNLGERCEIGIATDEAYRRRGLATLEAIHMIRQGIEKGIRRFGWHCWLRNEGSNATARRLGFEHINEHGSYFLPA